MFYRNLNGKRIWKKLDLCMCTTESLCCNPKLMQHCKPLCVCRLSRFSYVQLFATLWTIAHQAPHSVGFSRQEYFSGFPCPPPGYLPDPGIKPSLLHLLHCRWLLYYWGKEETQIICSQMQNEIFKLKKKSLKIVHRIVTAMVNSHWRK